MFLGLFILIYLVVLLYWVFFKDWVISFNVSLFGYLRKFYIRVFSFGDVILVVKFGKSLFFKFVYGFVVIGFLLIFFLVGVYWFFFFDFDFID